MPPYHHVKVTWGSRHRSGTGGGGGWGVGFRKPISNHKELYCRDKRSILNVHFKEETSLLIQKRKSARYENSFCSL